ncbi:MAG: 2Fe-2S iron-sulfur cluster-binding protein [Acidimicrobiales bacterium]
MTAGPESAGAPGGVPVTVQVGDGSPVTVAVPAGVTILDAALAAGIALPHQCRSGSCGSCRAQLLSGATADVADRVRSLPPAAHRAGVRLLCSTLPDGPCEVRVEARPAAAPAAGTIAARVSAIEDAAAGVRRLVLDLDTPLHFDAGQYVLLTVPGAASADGPGKGPLERAYSIVSPPSDDRRLVFLVDLVPGGAMAGWVGQRAAPGDRITLRGPFGGFALHPGRHPALFVAGGTGIAPVLSLLDEHRRRFAATRPAVVCFACRNRARLVATDDLDLRRAWMPRLTVRVGLSRPDPHDAWDGPVADPVALIRADDVGPGVRAYVAGPPAMVAAAFDRLVDLGLPPASITTEGFSPGEHR